MNIQSELVTISQAKHTCDNLFSSLRRSYNQLLNSELSDKQLLELKANSAHIFNDISIQCSRNMKSLSSIKSYLSTNTQQQIMYESLLEYFNQTKEKAKLLYNSLSDKVIQLQKLRLVAGGSGKYSDYSEQQSLINSHNKALQATEMARDVQKSLMNQAGSLERIKRKVGDFIGQLNIGRTLIRMIGNRSSEDYKLILILTGILIVQIIICYFWIRPWIKG